jgi:hypothetical protein
MRLNKMRFRDRDQEASAPGSNKGEFVDDFVFDIPRKDQDDVRLQHRDDRRI